MAIHFKKRHAKALALTKRWHCTAAQPPHSRRPWRLEQPCRTGGRKL